MFGSRWHVMTSREATLACCSKGDKTENQQALIGKASGRTLHTQKHCRVSGSGSVRIPLSRLRPRQSSAFRIDVAKAVGVCYWLSRAARHGRRWHRCTATVLSAPDGSVAKEQLSADMIRNCVAGDDPVMYHWAICWLEFRQHSHREHCDPVLVTD
jgi:hypothetical protein